MTRREFLDRIDRQVLVLDGALATLLLSDKVPGPGFCPEVFLLEAFEDVVAVHARYVRAGADILLSNTFGGNRARLQASGLSRNLAEVNRLGVDAARRAAGSRALVAANIGPTGLYGRGRKRPPAAKVQGIFAEQVEALLAGKPDLFVLETFVDSTEISLALRAVRGATELPAVALMTFTSGAAQTGAGPAEAREKCLSAGADVVGVNCSTGAAGVLAALRGMAEGYRGPLAAEPNAGLPRWRQGKRRYEEDPAVLARYAPRYVRSGARIVGGCCGTTPAHISALRRSLV